MKINRKIRTTSLFLGLPLLALYLSPVISSFAASTPILGTTSKFAVLATTSITNIGTTTISGVSGGDIGLSPGTAYTGGGTVTQNGVLHINDAAAATGKTDLNAAVTSINSFTFTPLAGGSDLAGKTITPGNYTSASGAFTNSGNVIFDGQDNSASIFIIKAASTLDTSKGSTITLVNGAQPCHIYWSVGATATLGASSTFAGYIFAGESITANNGAKIKGSLFSKSDSVKLDSNTITTENCTSGSVASATPTAAASATATATPTAAASATATPAVAASSSAIPKAAAGTDGPTGAKGNKGDQVSSSEADASTSASPEADAGTDSPTEVTGDGGDQISSDDLLTAIEKQDSNIFLIILPLGLGIILIIIVIFAIFKYFAIKKRRSNAENIDSMKN